MNRYFAMTEKAQQSTWCKLSNGKNHIPTQWLILGDKKEGYTISAVNEDFTGFDFITLRSLYAAKRFIDVVNATGESDMKQYCSVSSFAWKIHPMPTN